MYLCLCNAISDTQVEQAVRAGARRLHDVYARCGCRAQCGNCATSLLGVMRGLAAAPATHQER